MKDVRRQRRSWVALAVGVGGIALSPGSGHAQTAPPLGATGPGQKPLAFDVIGSILYDSNVVRGQDPLATSRDLHKSDVTYSPAVQVTSNLPLGRSVVYLNATVGYDFHQYNKVLESGRADVLAGGTMRFGPCQLGLTGSYGLRQSDLSNLPTDVTRNRETLRSAGGQVSCTAHTGLTGFFGLEGSDTKNSAEDALVNSNSLSFNGGIGYNNARLGSVQIVGGYTKTRYDQGALVVLTQPSYESHSIGLKFSRPIGNRLSGSASIGWQQTESQNSTHGKSSTLYGSGQLDYRLNSRAGLTLVYNRSGVPATIQGFDYVIDQSIEFSGRYTLSSRLHSTFGAKWDKSDSQGLGPVLVASPDRERTRTLFGSLTYDVGHLSAALNVNQEKREAQPEIFDYTAYQVGARLARSF